jgi:hypothetical protein
MFGGPLSDDRVNRCVIRHQETPLSYANAKGIRDASYSEIVLSVYAAMQRVAPLARQTVP